MTRFKLSPLMWQSGLGVVLTWLVCGVGAWWWLEPQAQLVTARKPTTVVSAQALEALARPVVAVDLAALERVKLWGLERNGQALAPTAAAEVQKVLWSVTARVVRPNERYLVLYQPESKVVQQIKEGELMPDGSKLIKLGLDSFTVRLPNGKTHITVFNS